MTETAEEMQKFDTDAKRDDATQGQQQGSGVPSERAAGKGTKMSDSLMKKVEKAKEESTSTGDLCCRIIAIVTSLICGTICCGVWIFLLIILPLAMLIVGAIHKNDCPRERFIPIWMIVTGCFGVLKALFNFLELLYKWCCLKDKAKEEDERAKKGDMGPDEVEVPKKARPQNPADVIVNLFLICWFIAGSVWTYRIHRSYQSVDATADDYCHRGLYLFAFWVITLHWLALLFVLVFGCCLICCVGVIASRVGKRSGEWSPSENA